MPRAPLPVRDGLNPTRVRLPAEGPWLTVVEYLRDGFRREIVGLAEMVAAGAVVDERGAVIDDATPFEPLAFVYFYRHVAPEPRVPFELDVLHHDDDLIVVDKPHFLATTPRGQFIVESATVRLRRLFDMPELSPVHRLDRITAGVLIFVTRKELRGPYQMLFAQRRVHKVYEAVAAYDPALDLPATVRNRIVKYRGSPLATVEEGLPNAVSVIELVDVRGRDGLYRLTPHTGKTHQLRLHMAALGIPIRNDPFYPDLLDVSLTDYSAPLQLLAREISFPDPLSGRSRCFTSARELAAWPR